jgi:hypothetical protein
MFKSFAQFSSGILKNKWSSRLWKMQSLATTYSM